MINQEFEIRFKRGSRLEQMEMACLSLLNIFSSLYTSALTASDDEERFQEITIDLSKIGTAFVDSVRENLSHFIEPDEDKELNADELLNISEFIEPEDLAVSLSKILNNPEMPITLYNSLQNAIAETYSGGDNDILNQFESSPEFMKAVIDACRKDEN